MKKLTAEEADAAYGPKGWDGFYVDLEDGTEELVVVTKPSKQVYSAVVAQIEESPEAAEETLLRNTCATHSFEELTVLAENAYNLTARLATSAFALATNNVRAAKKKPD